MLSVLVFASLVGLPLKRLVAGRWSGADRPPRWTRLLVLGFAEFLLAGAVFAMAFRDGWQALAWGGAGYVIVSFALHRGLLIESVKTHAHALVLALAVPVVVTLLATTAGQTLYVLLGG